MCWGIVCRRRAFRGGSLCCGSGRVHRVGWGFQTKGERWTIDAEVHDGACLGFFDDGLLVPLAFHVEPVGAVAIKDPPGARVLDDPRVGAAHQPGINRHIARLVPTDRELTLEGARVLEVISTHEYGERDRLRGCIGGLRHGES